MRRGKDLSKLRAAAFNKPRSDFILEKRTPEFNRNIFSSDGTSLRFSDAATHSAYEEECKALDNKYYAIERAKHGIWCGNQSKYVHSREEMNDCDSKTMEDRFDQAFKAKVFTGYLMCHDVTFKQVACIPLVSSIERLTVEFYLEQCVAHFHVREIETKLRSAFAGCTISVKVL